MHVRLATVDDAPRICAIYAPNVAESAVSFELERPTDVEMAKRITKILQQLPWLVCKSEGVICGYAYAARHRARPAYQWSVESSVYVAASAQRHGVARRLYAELFARLVRQGYFTVYVGITLPNPASVALHEFFGFTPVGIYRNAGFKLGRWWDVGWWQKPLCDYRKPYARPLALRELNA